MLGRGQGELSVVRQCALLGVARSSLDSRPTGDSAEELALMRRIDRIFIDHPMYGSRRMQVVLARESPPAGRLTLGQPLRRMPTAKRPDRGQGLM